MQHGERITFDLQFQQSSYALFALIRPADFCRVLSNLFNNSVEAIEGDGSVEIALQESTTEVAITIQDNG